MTKGVVLIANNNGAVDYVKQAIYCAKRIEKYLKLPVTLITDSRNYAVETSNNVFDKIISTEYKVSNNNKIYYDGAMAHKILMFKNYSRTVAYYNTPYDQTILMDTPLQAIIKKLTSKSLKWFNLWILFSSLPALPWK